MANIDFDILDNYKPPKDVESSVDFSILDSKQEQTKESESINQDEIMKKLIADGIDGNMDEINALEDKVMRGKIKAAIVKAKRSS